jgi:hypothetical protein
MPQVGALAGSAGSMLGGMGGAGGLASAGMSMLEQTPGMQLMKGLMGGGEQQGAGGAEQAGGGSDDLMKIIQMLLEKLTGGKEGGEAGGAGGSEGAGGQPHSQSTNALSSDQGHKGQALDQAGGAGGDMGSLLSQLPAGTTITIGGGGK